MAKSTAEKLLIRPGTTVWAAPADGLERLGPLPAGVRVAPSAAGAATAFLFAADAAALRSLLDEHATGAGAAATLWIAYPKGGRSDINRDTVWPIAAEHGLRPIGQVAIDDEWSALRFRRLAEGEAPFTGRQATPSKEMA